MWDTHPDWLKPSKIPLTIVCGPPCSGKTTYINEHKKSGDIVIDLDAIRKQLFRASSDEQQLTERAIRLRNQMLARLTVLDKGRAWLIVSAPTQEERDWWKSKLGGKVVLLNPGIEECERRAVGRGTPEAMVGIKYWATKSQQPWHL